MNEPSELPISLDPSPERAPARLSRTELITGVVAVVVLMVVVAGVAFVAGRHGSRSATTPVTTTVEVTTTLSLPDQIRAWYAGVHPTLDQLDATDAAATKAAAAVKDQTEQCASATQTTTLAQALSQSPPPPAPALEAQWNSMISAANNLGSILVTVCTYLKTGDHAAVNFMGPLLLVATTANTTAIATFKATLARLAPAP